MADPSSWSLARRPFMGALAMVPFLNRRPASTGAKPQVTVRQSDSSVTIGNDLIEVTVRRDNGGIHQIRAVGLGLSLREPDAELEAEHWGLTFYNDEYEELRADSLNAPPPVIEAIEEDDRAELRVEWTDAELVTEDEGVVGRFSGSVVSRIVIDSESPLAQWHFDVKNDGDHAIRTASCPTINGIGPLDPDGDDELVVPQGMGRRSRNPTETGPLGISYPSGSGTMQFTAYTGNAGGFYTDARDTEGYAKKLLWGGGDGAIRYRVQHHAPRRAGADLVVPYPTSVGALDGDWYDAADRYRTWLLEEGWLSADEAGLPAWVEKLGAVFELTSYTRPHYPDPLPELTYDQVAERMTTLAEYLDAPLGLRWRGWQTHGRSGSLDWFPPKEGRPAFETALSMMREHDVHTIGFVSATWILAASDFWQENEERASAWLIRDEDGSRVEPATYGHDHPEEWILYRIEFAQSGWQREIQERLQTYAKAGGFDCQLDGFPHLWVADCYAEHHDHPPGFGGNWYPQQSRYGLEAMLEAIRTERPDFVLSGEGLSDFYLPYLQVGFVRDAAAERHLEIPEKELVDVVPVLPYALGDFHAARAATIFLGGADGYQRVVIARALVWGAIPRAHRPPDGEFIERGNPVLEYLKRATRCRSKYANRFVGRGRMLRQPTFETDVIKIETPTVEPGETTATGWTPAILASAWASSHGETGVLLTNVSADGPRTVELVLHNQPFSLPNEPWLVYTVRNGTYDKIASNEDDPNAVTIELAPWDIALLVIAPEDEARTEALHTIIEAQDAVSSDGAGRVEQAKRRFEEGEMNEAISIAQSVLDSDTIPSLTEAESETDQAGEEATRTVGETPGFTVVTGVAGLTAAVWSFLRRERGTNTDGCDRSD